MITDNAPYGHLDARGAVLPAAHGAPARRPPGPPVAGAGGGPGRSSGWWWWGSSSPGPRCWSSAWCSGPAGRCSSWWPTRARSGRQAPYALRGSAVAAGVAAVLLAYPLWFAVLGPNHFDGIYWPYIASAGSSTLRQMVSAGNAHAGAAIAAMTGYFGPVGPAGSYLGVPLVVLLVAGLAAYRRVRVLWLWAALFVWATVLSLGVALQPVRDPSHTRTWWLPWNAVSNLPILRNVLPGPVRRGGRPVRGAHAGNRPRPAAGHVVRRWDAGPARSDRNGLGRSPGRTRRRLAGLPGRRSGPGRALPRLLGADLPLRRARHADAAVVHRGGAEPAGRDPRCWSSPSRRRVWCSRRSGRPRPTSVPGGRRVRLRARPRRPGDPRLQRPRRAWADAVRPHVRHTGLADGHPVGAGPDPGPDRGPPGGHRGGDRHLGSPTYSAGLFTAVLGRLPAWTHQAWVWDAADRDPTPPHPLGPTTPGRTAPTRPAGSSDPWPSPVRAGLVSFPPVAGR